MRRARKNIDFRRTCFDASARGGSTRYREARDSRRYRSFTVAGIWHACACRIACTRRLIPADGGGHPPILTSTTTLRAGQLEELSFVHLIRNYAGRVAVICTDRLALVGAARISPSLLARRCYFCPVNSANTLPGGVARITMQIGIR